MKIEQTWLGWAISPMLILKTVKKILLRKYKTKNRVLKQKRKFS